MVAVEPGQREDSDDERGREDGNGVSSGGEHKQNFEPSIPTRGGMRLPSVDN